MRWTILLLLTCAAGALATDSSRAHGELESHLSDYDNDANKVKASLEKLLDTLVRTHSNTDTKSVNELDEWNAHFEAYMEKIEKEIDELTSIQKPTQTVKKVWWVSLFVCVCAFALVLNGFWRV